MHILWKVALYSFHKYWQMHSQWHEARKHSFTFKKREIPVRMQLTQVILVTIIEYQQ